MNINLYTRNPSVFGDGASHIFSKEQSMGAKYGNPFGGVNCGNPSAGLERGNQSAYPVYNARSVGKTVDNQTNISKILSETRQYAQNMNTQRQTRNQTSASIKQLKYDFKRISTQIARCKTSANAKQLVGKARREVLRLQNQKASGKYEDEEIQNAINHAKEMVKIARKKARNLQEEELVKVTGERESAYAVFMQEEEWKEELTEGLGEKTENILGEDLEDVLSEDLGEILGEVLEEEFNELMDELMDDYMDELMDSFEVEVDTEDYKKMKLKHRQKEEKDLCKADMKYLKAEFERLEKLSSSGTPGNLTGGMTSDVAGIMAGGAPAAVQVDVLI